MAYKVTKLENPNFQDSTVQHALKLTFSDGSEILTLRTQPDPDEETQAQAVYLEIMMWLLGMAADGKMDLPEGQTKILVGFGSGQTKQ